jgi:hypothetical protein
VPLSEFWLAREERARVVPAWTDDRRKLYLLCAAARPLSVDRAVWPLEEKGQAVFISFVNARLDDERTFGDWNRVDVPAEVELIGYDVADATMLSALMNCAFSEPDARTAATRWSARLNEHHLFGNAEDALAFRSESETRVPEHAPFFVYGLYR